VNQQSQFRCANTRCNETTVQPDTYCQNCEEKIRAVEDRIDNRETEVVPGVWLF
jgi:hypothetical protein